MNQGYILESQVLGLKALMATLCRADNWRITDQWVMDARVWNQVGLELVQVDVQRSIKSQ
jgi:hypothetical protein